MKKPSFLDRRSHAVVVRMILQIVVIIAFIHKINCSGIVLSFPVVINRDFKIQLCWILSEFSSAVQLLKLNAICFLFSFG